MEIMVCVKCFYADLIANNLAVKILFFLIFKHVVVRGCFNTLPAPFIASLFEEA